MSNVPYNPFIEGSEEISDEEAAVAAKALAEEAASMRAKTVEIKKRAAEARVQKEAARKAEIARIEAELATTRAQVIKTVASIPRASDNSTLRPVPPDLETAGPDSSITSSSGSFFSLDNPVSTLDLIIDIGLAAIAITFTFLIFNNLQ